MLDLQLLKQLKPKPLGNALPVVNPFAFIGHRPMGERDREGWLPVPPLSDFTGPLKILLPK